MTMTAEPARKKVTYADLSSVPEHLVAEIVDGELVTHPRPSPRHGGATIALGVRLGSAFQFGDYGGPGGWIFIAEPEIRFGDDILVPDIAGWRRERLSAYPERNYFEVVPDWICEVLSAATEKRDRSIKKRIYAEAGVPHLWLIDPRLQLLEVHELVEGRWAEAGTWNSADDVSAPPFHAISFSLADLWPLDRPLGFNENPQALYAGDR